MKLRSVLLLCILMFGWLLTAWGIRNLEQENEITDDERRGITPNDVSDLKISSTQLRGIFVQPDGNQNGHRGFNFGHKPSGLGNYATSNFHQVGDYPYPESSTGLQHSSFGGGGYYDQYEPPYYGHSIHDNNHGGFGGNFGGITSSGHDGHKHLALKNLLIPLAGIAILGAAAALSSNPVLLQLGVINGHRRRRRAIAGFPQHEAPVIPLKLPN